MILNGYLFFLNTQSCTARKRFKCVIEQDEIEF